jgi:hypothetical protein
MNISVSYNPGSGGSWLSQVLYQCIQGHDWKTQTVNFHNVEKIVKHFHESDGSDNIISIGNGNYRFNFWKLYLHKRILSDRLKYQRVRGHRLVVSPYIKSTNEKEHFFWLIDQCKYIQLYQYNGNFDIDWGTLFHNPKQVWNIIENFLSTNKIKNQINFETFLFSLENYKNTCYPINYKLNFNNKAFLIWALSFLIIQNIWYPGDSFEDFGTDKLNHWILGYQKIITEYTNLNLLVLHR